MESPCCVAIQTNIKNIHFTCLFDTIINYLIEQIELESYHWSKSDRGINKKCRFFLRIRDGKFGKSCCVYCSTNI